MSRIDVDANDRSRGGFRSEVQPRRQHWFLNEKSGFLFRTPAFCSVSRGQRRLGEKEYRAPSVTPGVALRDRTQAAPSGRCEAGRRRSRSSAAARGNRSPNTVGGRRTAGGAACSSRSVCVVGTARMAVAAAARRAFPTGALRPRRGGAGAGGSGASEARPAAPSATSSTIRSTVSRIPMAFAMRQLVRRGRQLLD